MPRFTIEGSPITVTYGEDKETGIYLCAYDERLRLDETAGQEVKHVFHNQIKDKNGLYFNIRTGGHGGSDKVSQPAMVYFLRKFGVPEKRIEALLKGKSFGSPCEICKILTTTSCSQCHAIYYCSKECQKKDWFIHKYFCESLPLPKKIMNEKSIYGILLPEKGKNPLVIKVLFEEGIRNGEVFSLPDCRAIMGDVCDRRGMHFNPLKGKNLLPHSLEFNFRDNFLNEVSTPNQTVQNLTKGKNPFNWRGPILVLKNKQNIPYHDLPEYVDIELNDLYDIIDYFLWYGSQPL